MPGCGCSDKVPPAPIAPIEDVLPSTSCCSYRSRCPQIDGHCCCKEPGDEKRLCECCCCCVCPCECRRDPEPVPPLDPPQVPEDPCPGGHMEYTYAPGINAETPVARCVQGPAGEVPPDSRAPWGWSPLSPIHLLYRTHGCCPGQTWWPTVYGTQNGEWVSGCYPPLCAPDGSIPTDIQFRDGVPPACVPRPAGWNPLRGCLDYSTGLTEDASPPPAGWQPQPISPPGSFPVRPPGAPPPLPETPDAPPPPDFGKSKHPLAPPPKQEGVVWPGAPDYLYIDIYIDPCHPHDPPVPEAPIGYTHTGVSIIHRIMVTCAPSVYPGLSANSVTFQYIDMRILAQQGVAPPGQQVPPPPQTPGDGTQEPSPESPGSIVDTNGQFAPAPVPPVTGSPPVSARPPGSPIDDPESKSGAAVCWHEGTGLGPIHVGDSTTVRAIWKWEWPEWQTVPPSGRLRCSFWGWHVWFEVERKGSYRDPHRFGFYQYVRETISIEPAPPPPMRNPFPSNRSSEKFKPDDLGTGVGWFLSQENHGKGKRMEDSPGIAPLLPGADLGKSASAALGGLLPRDAFPRGLPPETLQVNLRNEFVTYVVNLTKKEVVGWFEWSTTLRLSSDGKGFGADGTGALVNSPIIVSPQWHTARH